jgi:hypothetical protein
MDYHWMLGFLTSPNWKIDMKEFDNEILWEISAQTRAALKAYQLWPEKGPSILAALAKSLGPVFGLDDTTPCGKAGTCADCDCARPKDPRQLDMWGADCGALRTVDNIGRSDQGPLNLPVGFFNDI